VCGLAGILQLDGSPVGGDVLRRMTDAIAHRGPDGEGTLVDGPAGLGHRRLAIIDLSDAGRQPMTGEDGQVAVIHNGEIYNFQQLRLELQGLGHRFHSRTDTEVIVHAYEEWGDACVERFNGMFAFAVWDRKRKRLLLARDRYGVKPLYWWSDGTVLLFASEIKALLEHPRVRRDVCVGALNEYFTFQNVLTDRTLFEGVRLLPPGSRLVADPATGRPPRIERYWDYAFTDDAGAAGEAELVERVATTFREAVTRQLVSDVPVGGYLSGGMDSSSLVSIAAGHVPRLATFTAGFDMSSASGLEISFDERDEAESLANLLKTEHYEVVLHAGDMEWVLPELIWHLEDLRVGQCYPNYYVARLASKFVKVVLSGAGGDELFGGYPWRYYRGDEAAGSTDFYGGYYGFWQRLVPDEDKARLFAPDTLRALGDESAFDAFRGVFDGWQGGTATPESRIEASLYFELKTFLHGLLVVEDKISMAHSLETRVPFLDNDLVDLALRIPARHKIVQSAAIPRPDENTAGKRHLYERQTSEGKAILRNAMAAILPSQVAGRPKQGFSAPDASWFRGESVDYINRLLRDRKAAIYDFLDPAYVAGVLDQHCSGTANRRLLIWSLLSFEWWCRAFLRGEAPDRAHALPLRR
jgi:asparagine synthase (glutamine-hydrolysing)